MSVSSFRFGQLKGSSPVTAWYVTGETNASVTILDYGATIQSLCVPNRVGRLTDVVLGYDTAAAYEAGTCFLGATIGRVGNRIGGGSFSLNGRTYQLARNDGPNHLHGGVNGFHRRMWNAEAGVNSVRFSRLSLDGEEGYPGNLQVSVTFTLTKDDRLVILYEADTDRDTLVNLTNHSYFNLNGDGSVLTHKLQIFAERFCENGENCLPTGRLLNVENTPFDFRVPKAVGAEIDAECVQLKRFGGYDHNYVLSGKKAAVLCSEENGIEMTVWTDSPGMQVFQQPDASAGERRRGDESARRGMSGKPVVSERHELLRISLPCFTKRRAFKRKNCLCVSNGLSKRQPFNIWKTLKTSAAQRYGMLR